MSLDRSIIIARRAEEVKRLEEEAKLKSYEEELRMLKHKQLLKDEEERMIYDQLSVLPKYKEVIEEQLIKYGTCNILHYHESPSDKSDDVFIMSHNVSYANLMSEYCRMDKSNEEQTHTHLFMRYKIPNLIPISLGMFNGHILYALQRNNFNVKIGEKNVYRLLVDKHDGHYVTLTFQLYTITI